jgi:formylglycine-generating enzyme required for sulfatase activity
MMRLEVTNQQFAAFVAASRHLTDPERSGFGYVWDGRWRSIAEPRSSRATIRGRAEHAVAGSVAAGAIRALANIVGPAGPRIQSVDPSH